MTHSLVELTATGCSSGHKLRRLYRYIEGGEVYQQLVGIMDKWNFHIQKECTPEHYRTLPMMQQKNYAVCPLVALATNLAVKKLFSLSSKQYGCLAQLAFRQNICVMSEHSSQWQPSRKLHHHFVLVSTWLYLSAVCSCISCE